MEFRLLGAFEAGQGGRIVEIGRRQERLLLGILLLSEGLHVSTDRLLDLIWNGRPPRSARGAVHTYVARLRTALRPYGVSIVGRNGGYAVAGAEIHIDADWFVDLAGHALESDDQQERADRLKYALDLWRGPVLADVADDRLRERLGRRLDELRLKCLDRRAEALLEVGRPDVVAAELGGWIESELRHEALAGYLMVALYRTDRRADALDLYDRVRRTLVDEFGVDPSLRISDLYLRILRDDPSLLAPPLSSAFEAPTRGPNHLPPVPANFVGREADLAVIDRFVNESSGGAVAVTALGGMAGVGKTTVALEWGHRAAARFPDGRFYLNLRGYDIDEPMPTKEALNFFIRALGHPADSIPDDLAGAGALYRELLADKGALIVLDNARSAEQVRPLIPNSRTTVVLVTSRNRLTGLVARDGARAHTLGVLKPDESAALLTLLAGADRLAAEPGAAEDLAELVGHLPLALRIVGALLATDPNAGIADMVDSLRHDSKLERIDLPDDPRSSLRTLFELSYDGLDDAAKRLFRLAGSSPLIDFSDAPVAALANLAIDQARATLDRLCELSLVLVARGATAAPRYAMHDLVRDFAREKAPPDEAAAATSRLLEWLVRHACAASEAAFPGRWRLPYPQDAQAVYTAESARAFLTAESDNLLAGVRTASTSSPPDAAWPLVNALHHYFWNTDPYSPAWRQAASLALSAAIKAGDQLGQLAVRAALAEIEADSGDDASFLEHIHAVLKLSEACQLPTLSAGALGSLGSWHYARGHLEESLDYQNRALAINRAAGQRNASARNLVNRAIVQGRMGRLADAVASLGEAEAVFRDTRDDVALAVCLNNLGVMQHRQGDLVAALATLREAHALYTAVNNGDGQGNASDSIAAVLRDMGNLDDAEANSLAAIRQFTDLGEDQSLVMAINTYASILLKRGKSQAARDSYWQSLADSRRLRMPRPEAEALIGLARADLAESRLDDASRNATEAMAIARERGFVLIEADALTVRAETIRDSDPGAAYHAAETAATIYRASGATSALGNAARLLAILAPQDPTSS